MSKEPGAIQGYLGSIGFAFPAALGAWSATQDFPELNGRKVVAILAILLLFKRMWVMSMPYMTAVVKSPRY